MNKVDTTQGFLCPWGVSHKMYTTPTNQKVDGRKAFIVETHYYLRTKLPKYVRRMYLLGAISAAKMREVFELFEAHFRGADNKRRFEVIHCFFHDIEGEIAVKMVINDETYTKSRIKQLYARFKDMLDEILDYFRAELRSLIEHHGGRYFEYKLSVHGQICFARSP